MKTKMMMEMMMTSMKMMEVIAEMMEATEVARSMSVNTGSERCIRSRSSSNSSGRSNDDNYRIFVEINRPDPRPPATCHPTKPSNTIPISTSILMLCYHHITSAVVLYGYLKKYNLPILTSRVRVIISVGCGLYKFIQIFQKKSRSIVLHK
jgi:hypothetical protein